MAGGTATQFQGKGSSSDLMPSRGRGNGGVAIFRMGGSDSQSGGRRKSRGMT